MPKTHGTPSGYKRRRSLRRRIARVGDVAVMLELSQRAQLEKVRRNRAFRARIRQEGIVRAPHGIDELAPDPTLRIDG